MRAVLFSISRFLLAMRPLRTILPVMFFSGQVSLLSAQASIPKYLKFSVEINNQKLTAVLRVNELVGSDMSEDQKDKYSLGEAQSYNQLAWNRIAPPTISYDCAGLVLTRLRNAKPYKIGADNFYHDFIQRFCKRLESAEQLQKNDIAVFIKTTNGGSLDMHGNFRHADHVAIVVNDAPVTRTSSLFIHTKDEEESTFENITNLENFAVYGFGEFWTKYGSIRNAQFWRIEKMPAYEFTTEIEYWKSRSFPNLKVDVFDGETDPAKPLTEGTVQVMDLFGYSLGERVPIIKGSATFVYDMSNAKGPPWRVAARANGYQERWSDLTDEWRDPDRKSPAFAIHLNKQVDAGDADLNWILNTTFDFIWGNERKGTITFSADGKAHPSWTMETYSWTSIKPSATSPTSLHKVYMGKDYIVVFRQVVSASKSSGFEGEIDPGSPKKSTLPVRVMTPEVQKKPVVVFDNTNKDNNSNNQSTDKLAEANTNLQLLKILQNGGQITNPGVDDLIQHLRQMASKYNLQKVKNSYNFEDCLNAIRNYQQQFGNVDVFMKVRDTYQECLKLMIQELEEKIANKKL